MSAPLSFRLSPDAEKKSLIHELMALMAEQQAEILLLQSRLSNLERKRHRHRVPETNASGNGIRLIIKELPSDVITPVPDASEKPSQPHAATMSLSSSKLDGCEQVPPPMSAPPPFLHHNAMAGSSHRHIRPRYKAVSYEDLREEERKLQDAAIKQNISSSSTGGMLSNVLSMFCKKATPKLTTEELSAQVAAGILKPADALDASKPPPMTAPAVPHPSLLPQRNIVSHNSRTTNLFLFNPNTVKCYNEKTESPLADSASYKSEEAVTEELILEIDEYGRYIDVSTERVLSDEDVKALKNQGYIWCDGQA